MTGRLDKVRAKMVERKLDVLIVSQRDNQRYLSGFTGGADFDSILLISAIDAGIATDSRYWEMAERAPSGLGLVKLKRDEYDLHDAIRDFAAARGARSIGFESKHVTYAHFRRWQKAARKAQAKLLPTENLVEHLRAVKDPAELATIRRAVELTDMAFAHFCTNVRIGMTEKQGAWLIESFMRQHGGDRIAFEFIVAGGPNAALPHAEPTDRAFQRGEPVTIDIGVRIDDYNSDMTRTFCLGEANDKFKQVYAVVLKAQETVERKTRAGLRGKQADAMARRVIEKAGYGDNFGHGLGHGVGLQVHELPSANRKSKDVLEPNMTLTVEPGIYIPGWGGVRLEDLVVIEQEGVQVLTKANKAPVIVPETA
jgi:Xaa-Pro aminopeptidase